MAAQRVIGCVIRCEYCGRVASNVLYCDEVSAREIAAEAGFVDMSSWDCTGVVFKGKRCRDLCPRHAEQYRVEYVEKMESAECAF